MSKFVSDGPCARVDLVDTSFPGLMAGTKQLVGAAYEAVGTLGVDDPTHAFAAEMLILAGLSLLMVADKGGSSMIHYDNLHIDGQKLPVQTAHIMIGLPNHDESPARRTSPVRSLKQDMQPGVVPNPPALEDMDADPDPDPVVPNVETKDLGDLGPETLSDYDEAVLEWERDQQRFADKPRVTDTGAKTGRRPRSVPSVPKRAAGALHGGGDK